MPFSYYVATLTFVLALISMIFLTAYKFEQLELRKKRLELSREFFEHMMAHHDEDDGDDGPDLSDIFSRPIPDPSLIGKH